MSVELKKCHNEELQKKLDKKITQAKYGAFKTIIDEYFQRRMYEFGDLEGFDIEQEIANFARNVNGISYNSKIGVLAQYKKRNDWRKNCFKSQSI